MSTDGSVYASAIGLGVSSDEAFNDLRQNAREEYSLFRLQLARLQSLYFGTELARAKDWSLFIKVEGQYAGEALIPAEQFAVGGMNTVRGYEERALLGDHGGLATMEIRSPLLQNLLARPFSRRKRDSDNRAMDRLQILAFADAGFITRAELLQGEERSETLTSSGLGLRWSWSRYAQLRADMGYRFNETFTQDKGVGFHISAQLQY
jgi:hemolysin activation/secretion protein